MKLSKRARFPLAILGAAILLALIYLANRSPEPVCIAAANSMTGPSSRTGLEAVAAAQILVDEVNRRGGVNGRLVELVRFDDEGQAEKARANVQAIADSPCLAVLGHRLSSTSVAAGPGYRDAGIAAVTGSSHADSLTVGNPYYFRAQNTASTQGRSVGEYLRIVMQAPKVELISSDAAFDRGFSAGFARAYGGNAFASWTFDARPETRAASVGAMAGALAKAKPELIVIGTGEENIPVVLAAIRRAGITSQVIAAGGAGNEEFLQAFANEPEEKAQPGFFARNLYAVAPVIFDSAGDRAQAFASAYNGQTGRRPGWIAASEYDAARLLVEALRRAKVANRPDSVRADRQRVRAVLAGMTSPATGVSGLSRTLYFDELRNMPRPIRLGFFSGGHFVSAPEQLVQVERPDLMEIGEEMRRGTIVAADGRYYWRQRVVYTGIDINRLNRIDVSDGRFSADVNLWMRFSGSNDAPTRVEFPSLLDQSAFHPQRPVESGLEDGLNYRLYRIAADFKANYDLHEYPFDRQELLIRFQNREQRRELVTYVIDRFGLDLTSSNSATPRDPSALAGLQQWRLGDLRYFVDSLSSTSTLGKPSMFDQGARTEFAGFNVAVVLQRDYGIFVIKTMIPLVLLVLVVFATLFLPSNLFRERINIPITAILTSAVLLLSVNNQLGDVGYTVALEYIFYAFFALCLISMLIGVAHDALMLEDKPAQAALVARSGQIFYALSVILVIAFFWWRYGSGAATG